MNSMNFSWKLMKAQPSTKKRWRSTMTKRLRSTIFWLVIWCFCSILGCVCFRKTQVQMDWPLLDHPTIPSRSCSVGKQKGFVVKNEWTTNKIYFGNAQSANEVIEAYHLDEVWLIKCPMSCCDVKSSAGWRQPNMYPLANYRFFVIF